MGALLLQNLRHIVRTRLLVFLLLFSFLIQYAGVKLLRSVTVNFQGIISTIDAKDALFIGLLFQLFTGAFLAAVYGIWMVPHAHQGQRSHLTFTLPVSKWMYPLAYAISMLGLLALQHLILVVCYSMNFGFEAFADPKFPWQGLALCVLMETLAFEMFLFAFAFSSMTLGQIPTFFLGVSLSFVLQVAGALFRFDLEKITAEGGVGDFSTLKGMRWFYNKLPPVGELVYDLRHGFLKPEWVNSSLMLWAIWLVIFVLLFRYKLRYPTATKSAEV